MTEKQQFDTYLGGAEELPAESPILKLASARANEIAAMTYSIDNPQQTKRVFQKLPVHMRRRIMSHNAKRMPRRLREIHIRQMSKSGLPPKAKRPSRKYRRRPSNLVEDYKRRQRDKSWLETHVWHAKRFKMIDKWGYRIPDRSNNRCFRSSYRAVARHCLIQDISYYSCIEISGEPQQIRRTLNRHCDPSKLTFAARAYARGNREGNLMFYEREKSPTHPIGSVRFMWRDEEKPEHGTIWIWAHPAIYQQVLDQIRDSFGFRGEEATPDDGKCRLVLLRNKLNRFRLYGPLSLALLVDCLRLPDLAKISEPMDIDAAQKPWESGYYENEENRRAFEVQSEVFQRLRDLKSPSQLPPSIVMSFTVLDPRFSAPARRTKSDLNEVAFEQIPVPPTLASRAPLWEVEVREAATASFVKTSEIDKLRSENLVPGVQNDDKYPEDLIPKIPIMVIQRDPRRDGKSLGFGSGVDVIVPSGWGIPFWVAFILRCGKPAGLRESRSIMFESLELGSGPDTASGAKEALEEKYALMESYFRRPPNRRSNYVKLGISSPFHCEWGLLIKEWENRSKFYVATDKNQLDKTSNGSEYGILVPVKVSILQKGCARDFAVIAVPTEEDLDSIRRNKTWSGPVAAISKDGGEAERKRLRRGHIALLRRLRRQRVKQRLTGDVKELKLRAKTVVDDQAEKMRSLYLPDCKTVRFSTDREVMGYVVRGDFSFTESKGVGLGYVAVSSMEVLRRLKSDLVLVRNTKSRQYRFARFSLLI